MSLIALTDKRDIAVEFAAFWRHFETEFESSEREHEVACVGGTAPATLRWYPRLEFWAMQPQRANERYWCAFGTEDPAELAFVPTILDIMVPMEGTDRRCGGVFVRSNNGTIYLAHSGGIGGGRVGVGKKAFVSFYGDATIDTVTWPNKVYGEYIVIGALDDDGLRENVAQFVHKVAEFKRASAQAK